jgi:hypothetical protein
MWLTGRCGDCVALLKDRGRSPEDRAWQQDDLANPAGSTAQLTVARGRAAIAGALLREARFHSREPGHAASTQVITWAEGVGNGG